MNLQLIKIKKQNAFDYNLLSDFMKKKNGKLIFTAGFGNAGKISDNTTKDKLNLMQKFERKFQFHSIIKSYNDTFHIHPKSEKNYISDDNQKTYNELLFPQISKIKDSKNLKYININKNIRQNQFNRNILRNVSMKYNANISINGNNNYLLIRKYNDNTFPDNNDDSVDYNSYFYNTINSFPYGNNNYNEKECNKNNGKGTLSSINFFNNSNSKKLIRNISQDCIYLFGQNKIIYKNKKKRNGDKNKIEIQKTPFIDYNKEFSPSKTKYRLRKNYKFYKDENKHFENFSEMKQDYIMKIRKMFEKNKKIKYQREYLPSHNIVKTMIRKKKIFDKL